MKHESMGIYHHWMNTCGGECDDKPMDLEWFGVYFIPCLWTNSHLSSQTAWPQPHPPHRRGFWALEAAEWAGDEMRSRWGLAWSIRGILLNSSISSSAKLSAPTRGCWEKWPNQPKRLVHPGIVSEKSNSSRISGLYSNDMSNATGNWLIKPHGWNLATATNLVGTVQAAQNRPS